MPREEIRVALDLSDAIALIERQQQEIAALKAEVERLRELCAELVGPDIVKEIE